jgi:hypothetical protein
MPLVFVFDNFIFWNQLTNWFLISETFPQRLLHLFSAYNRAIPLETDQNKVGRLFLLYCRCDIILLPYFNKLKSLNRYHVTRELYSHYNKFTGQRKILFFVKQPK